MCLLQVRNVSLELAILRQRELASLQTKQLELIARLDADTGENLVDRLNLLEQSLANITSQTVQNSESGGGSGGGGGSPNSFRRLRRRVQTIERNVQRLTTALQTDDCASSPCKNGAICIDSYNSFQCLCSPNWEVCHYISCFRYDLYQRMCIFAGTNMRCRCRRVYRFPWD
jgi:hypothetical protein